MPNWVKNKLCIKGINVRQKMEKYFGVSEGYNSEYFDFNKLIPMPKELQDTVVSSETPKETYQKNKEKYGYESWYDWACANWGTKWNACETTSDLIDDETMIITFETAWAPPKQIFDKLAKSEPTLDFAIDFSEEGYGEYDGYINYKEGYELESCIYPSYSKSAIEHWEEMWEE